MAGRPSSSRTKKTPQTKKASKTNTRNGARNHNNDDVEQTAPDIPTSGTKDVILVAQVPRNDNHHIDNTDIQQANDIILNLVDNSYSNVQPINLETLQTGKGWLSSFSKETESQSSIHNSNNRIFSDESTFSNNQAQFVRAETPLLPNNVASSNLIVENRVSQQNTLGLEHDLKHSHEIWNREDRRLQKVREQIRQNERQLSLDLQQVQQANITSQTEKHHDFVEHKLNSQQIVYFNAFVKNEIWPKVKFVSDSALAKNQRILRDINKAMGFSSAEAQASYRKDLIKNLKTVLTQKRAYFIKTLRNVVIGKFNGEMKGLHLHETYF